jgi:hypothetical protein
MLGGDALEVSSMLLPHICCLQSLGKKSTMRAEQDLAMEIRRQGQTRKWQGEEGTACLHSARLASKAMSAVHAL